MCKVTIKMFHLNHNHTKPLLKDRNLILGCDLISILFLDQLHHFLDLIVILIVIIAYQIYDYYLL